MTQMATNYPVTLEELQQIQGVGWDRVRPRNFGQPFYDLIKRYCEENDIQRTDI
jgi:ATP-dependent DNA helicase RecQ